MTFMSTELSFGQSTEISFQLGSGFFSFGGSSATETSFVNISDVNSISSYTNNPYGKKSGFSYGFGIQVQKISKSNFIWGLQTGYESLSSGVNIDNAFGEITWSVKSGQATLTSQFINIKPLIGKRFEIAKNFKTDLVFGLDFGICLSTKEKFNLTTNQGFDVGGSLDRTRTRVDFRPRLEVNNYYKKIGLSIGYSYGLTNYTSGLDGVTRETMTRYFRVGLIYLIK